MKHAFADRSRYGGDPAFVDVPVDRLISRDYLRALAQRIDPEHTQAPDTYGTKPAEADAVRPPPADHGTSHFCVVDARGNAVSCTETINLEFGSLLAVPKYGFVLNDEMDDFTTRRGTTNAFGLTQSDRNLPTPGKRPLSSMTPTIVTGAGGNVELIAGGSGGPRIISATAQTILNVLLRHDAAAAAVARPRLHHQWMPDVLELEPPLMPAAAELEKHGHHVVPAKDWASVQVIRRSDGGWDAACDPRKGGAPAGE